MMQCDESLNSLLKNSIKHARYYWLLLAESHLTKQLFAICSGGSPGCRFRRDSRRGERPGNRSRPTAEVGVPDKTGWQGRGQQLLDPRWGRRHLVSRPAPAKEKTVYWNPSMGL